MVRPLQGEIPLAADGTLCAMPKAVTKTTRATQVLQKAGVAFTVHEYEYDPEAASIGRQAAEALGEDPARVLKTLMVYVDDKPACVIAPSDREVSMKKLAAVLGAKSARTMPPADAERISGYKVGGISPFGQTRVVPVVLEEGALEHALIYINAGQRGWQVRLNPRDAAVVLKAVTAPVAA
jgi:Cys-tRNA(Pro)/Cys-tRNA(Cys) deacylase